jgi:enoyl-CoA hydratase/carnithine racemase
MPAPDAPLSGVRYQVQEHVAVLTLDRPDARNAYSQEMVSSLVACLGSAQADPLVRCIIITGAGKAFSAGGDLKLMRDHDGMFAGDPFALRNNYQSGIQSVPRAVEATQKPMIAAINGAAIGAGLDLACMCDIRLASSRAKFGSTFVKLGLVPGDGGAFLLQRAVGFAHAAELTLTGDIIDAERALQIGLVSRVVSPEELMPLAHQVAGRISRNAPVAVQLTRRALRLAPHQTLDQALETASTYQGIAQNTRDHDEGVAALLEKRDPVFKGH